MRLQRIHRILPQVIDDLKIPRKDTRMLIVFRLDILLDRRGKLEVMGSSEGDLEDVAVVCGHGGPAGFDHLV